MGREEGRAVRDGGGKRRRAGRDGGGKRRRAVRDKNEGQEVRDTNRQMKAREERSERRGAIVRWREERREERSDSASESKLYPCAPPPRAARLSPPAAFASDLR